jgi:hypothetical protein
MGKEYNVRRTAGFFTFVVVVGISFNSPSKIGSTNLSVKRVDRLFSLAYHIISLAGSVGCPRRQLVLCILASNFSFHVITSFLWRIGGVKIMVLDS